MELRFFFFFFFFLHRTPFFFPSIYSVFFFESLPPPRFLKFGASRGCGVQRVHPLPKVVSPPRLFNAKIFVLLVITNSFDPFPPVII